MSTGWIQVVAFPTEYAQRMKTLPETAQRVREAEVSIRGWNFPHTDRENARAFADGFESVTNSRIFGDTKEGYRIHRSGLFVWGGLLREDGQELSSGSGRQVLSFINVIYSFTEYLLFLARLYEAIAPDVTVSIEIVLHGCKGRELINEGRGHLSMQYVSNEDTVSVAAIVKVVELRASYLEIAARMARDVFHVFNWFGVSENMIRGWQERFMKRQF